MKWHYFPTEWISTQVRVCKTDSQATSTCGKGILFVAFLTISKDLATLQQSNFKFFIKITVKLYAS